MVVGGHGCRAALHFGVRAGEDRGRVPALCWLPRLHGGPCEARFIANSGSCATTELSKLLTSCLAAVGKRVVKCCGEVYERSGGGLFWSIRDSGEILDGLGARDFNATGLSACGFSTLYTALPHNLIKDKLIDLIERAFRGGGSPCLACGGGDAFFASEGPKGCHAWSCRGVCDALAFLLGSIFIRFGAGLCGRVVGIPVGTGCAPLVAGLFLFCCGGDFVVSLSGGGRADVVGAFGAASGCLGGVLGVGGVCFDSMVGQICPSGLRLGGASASGAGAAFLDLRLSVSGGVVSAKICDRRGGFDFEVVNFPFLDGDVPRSASCGVCVSRLVRFARASGCVAGFGARGGLLARRLLKQGCRCRRLREAFSGFYGRYYDLISGFQVGLGSLLRRGLSGPGFCGGLVYKLGRIVGSDGFSAQFVGVVSHYKKIGCGINVLRQTACLVVGPVAVGGFAFLFNCTPVGRTSGTVVVPT